MTFWNDARKGDYNFETPNCALRDGEYAVLGMHVYILYVYERR